MYHILPLALKKNTESDVIEIEVKVEAEFRIRRYTKNTQNLRNETYIYEHFPFLQ